MAADIPLMLQTTYAELLDRVRLDALAGMADDGTFVVKHVRGRRYWYLQHGAAKGRAQTYVGPETPALLERIAKYRNNQAERRDRSELVRMLTRAGGLPRPLPAIGQVLSALSSAGIFRLRGVLVGTVAYQTYAAMLGVRLPAAMVQTSDIDLAQFADVSVAVGETTTPALEILRQANPSFRAVPHLVPPFSVSYAASNGLRVDFLTPNRGRDTEVPRPLLAFGTAALPLRFLDFLIRDPEDAVLLHEAGVLVSVPTPERFAIHKLIVAQRRRAGDAKRAKDLRQADLLLDVLVRGRPGGLASAWREATGRGKTWRRLAEDGLAELSDATRKAVGAVIGDVRGPTRD